jgi:hypothetical protein
MTEERLALSELLEKAGDGDFLRTVAEAVQQMLMEADFEGLIGAGRWRDLGDRRDCAAMLAPCRWSVLHRWRYGRRS